MEFTTPPSGPKRSRTLTENNESELRWSDRRRATTVGTYLEESDDEDNITVNPRAGAIIDEAESQDSEEESSAEACSICGGLQEDDDEAREWVQCDRCDVWQHTDCLGLSISEAKELNVFCRRCGPYGQVGALMPPAQQRGFPIRSSSMNVTPKAGKGDKFDALAYFKNNSDLSVKKNAKKVAWSPDTKDPARGDSEEDDPDRYTPSIEDAVDEEDGEYYRNEVSVDEEDEDYYRNVDYEDEDNESTIFVPTSPSPAPSNISEGSGGVKHNKSPRTKGVTDLGQRIVQRWMEGGYRAEIEAEDRAVDWGSDVSDVDIPDMSDGPDLLKKLAAQDGLIFSMKKKLEKRGARIAALKQEVEDLERENAMLKGVE